MTGKTGRAFVPVERFREADENLEIANRQMALEEEERNKQVIKQHILEGEMAKQAGAAAEIARKRAEAEVEEKKSASEALKAQTEAAKAGTSLALRRETREVAAQKQAEKAAKKAKRIANFNAVVRGQPKPVAPVAPGSSVSVTVSQKVSASARAARRKQKHKLLIRNPETSEQREKRMQYQADLQTLAEHLWPGGLHPLSGMNESKSAYDAKIAERRKVVEGLARQAKLRVDRDNAVKLSRLLDRDSDLTRRLGEYERGGRTARGRLGE